MKTLSVVGSQWGDEGKGKIVDLLSEKFDSIVRYQGGHNAGHTVIIGDEKYILHLIPSGILHPDKKCYMGNGMCIDPVALKNEVEELKKRGIEVKDRLFLSKRAHLIHPIHVLFESKEESIGGKSAIGTTRRGIGPSYGDKYLRIGIRCGEILDKDLFLEKLKFFIDYKKSLYSGEISENFKEKYEEFLDSSLYIREFLADTSYLINRDIEMGKKVLFEGAQGTMLDVDFGTYPFVTSSNSSVSGICNGSGVSPTKIDGIVGIFKAYTTRVGAGPFPTEIKDLTGDHLREKGKEYGASTGRPRRCGWLDLFQMKYSAMINDFSTLAITKLDVLGELEEIPICTGYEMDGKKLNTFPSTISELKRVKPIYEKLPGWKENLKKVKNFSDLPENAKKYIEFIENYLKTEISIISIGSKREETIVKKESKLFRWLA